MTEKRRVRALVLLSGGLDSILAVKVLQEQGIEVTGLSFVTPFFGADRARVSASELGIPCMICDMTAEHLQLVKHPRRGYGKYMNPCIDCHTLMIRKAGEIAERDGFDMIATGEVLGERPMSQNLASLVDVARDSGYADVVLRPLSAQLLSETRPEREGLVDRTRLLAIQGRSRKPQMELARRYGITNYAQPAGGCLLTDPHFSRRLKELLAHDSHAGVWEIELLKRGRHFRLADGTKVVVGRNERDNRLIEAAARPQDTLIVTLRPPGPVSLVVGGDAGELGHAVQITAAYADAGETMVEMEIRTEGSWRIIQTAAGDRTAWERFRI